MSSVIDSGVEAGSNLYNNIFNYILDIIILNGEGIFKFLFNRDIITTGIGIIIGTNISGLASVFTDVIISPLVSAVSSGYVKDLESMSFKILGIEFKIGLLLKKIIDFLTMIIVVYYIWKLTQITDISSVIDNMKKLKT
jgi:large-conductance mechanosensitive channel